MSEIDAVLNATAEQVKAAIPALNTYPYAVAGITAPAMMVFPPDRLPYGETFGDAATMWYTVRLLVARKQDGSDQAQLNGYMSRAGAESVRAAIEADPTLGGVVADVRVVEATNYGNWPVGSTTYLGFELRLQAMLD